MDEIMELLNTYLSISNGYLFTIVNSIDIDKNEAENLVFKYFSDFSSVNTANLYESLVSNNIPHEKANRIVDILKILEDTYMKYNVSNLDELSVKIFNCWNKCKFYSDDLIRTILLILNDKYLPKSSLIFDIYKDIVNSNMITDPNINVGSSFEKLYTMLPKDKSCYQSNLKVISNPLVDWSTYRNGTNPLEHYCFLYNNSKNLEERKYYHDLILAAIFGSCSLFNNKFKIHSNGERVVETINYYLVAVLDKVDDVRHSIKDPEFISEIRNLLLKDELFNHQMGLYTEKNIDADSVISELVLLRKNNKR